MQIAELIADIVFNFDSLKLKELVTKVGDLNISSVATTASLAGLADKVQDVIKNTSELAISVRAISEATGLPTDYIQELENLGIESLTTKEKVDSLLQSLSKYKIDLASGRANIQPAQFFGLRSTDSVEEMVNKLSSKMKTPDQMAKLAKMFFTGAKSEKEALAAFQTQVLAPLGVSSDMFPFMRKIATTDLSKVPHLSGQEIKDSLEATEQWKTATVELGVELEKIVTPLTVMASKLLEMVNSTQIISKTFSAVGIIADTIVQAAQIDWTNLKASAMNISNTANLGTLNSQRFGSGVKNWFDSQVSSLTSELSPRGVSSSKINNISVTVNSHDSADLEYKVRNAIVQALIHADSQVGQGT